MNTAHQHEDGEKVRQISATDIKEKLDGKDAKATVVEVTIEPGQSGLPHRHPGSAIGYVLEGEYELGIDDQPTKVFKAGETFYQVFTGEKAVFAPGRKVKILSFEDGTSNTGLVYEAGEPVAWTKPSDLAYDEKKPVPKLGGLFGGEFYVVMGDGSVLLIKKDPDEKDLRKLIMPSDGEPLDLSKLVK